VAGVGFLIAGMRKVRGRDLEDIGPVFGERAAGDRSGQQAREIERANTRQRPRTGGQQLGWAVADPHNLQQRQPGNRDGLEMLGPFGLGPHHAAGAAGSYQCLFKFECIPADKCPCDAFACAVAAEHLQRRRKMVREIQMNVSPASSRVA
jgi:hypothetical protein